MNILDNENVKLNYNSDNFYLTQLWIGEVFPEEFKFAINKSIEVIKENRVDYVISDTRLQGVVPQDCTDYAAKSLTTMLEHGMKKILFIIPHSLYTKMAIEMFSSETKKDELIADKVQFFTEYDDAISWIKNGEN